MLIEFKDPSERTKVIFEDDGKVAYAYLLVEGVISGDVWLYNVSDTPEEPEGRDPDQLPFLNSRRFVEEEIFEPIDDRNDVVVIWHDCPEGRQATLELKGRVHAILRPNSKPGWCRLAVRASSLARPLSEATGPAHERFIDTGRS